ncbi:hypothetical protein HKT18_03025 [Flavobacterium sp. IMCC34852]|uniref:Histidine kinase domain-containing protein n=1 Tax=Flavobacterium rivulicola TaxID=2732161 RepID=A0A7Y3R766_9FLAO|nr:histidine kinase [Flavobacterium sp. IMCC34852]NNT71180.1 hypothetical protein [Flavobacterium sp. IMCC34852]
MNKNILFSLLFLIILCGCHQSTSVKNTSPANDSIQKYLALAGNDTLPFDKRIKYNDKALSFVDLERNDSLKIRTLYNISYKYYELNKNKCLKRTSQTLLMLSKKKNDSTGLGYANRILGLYYMGKSDNEKAIEHLFTAKKIFNSQKNESYVNRVTLDILLTQSYACDYLGSNKTAFELLKNNVAKRDLRIKYFCYNTIANNLSGLKLHSKSIEYYLKAEKNSSNKSQRYTLYNNIAHEYINLKKHQNAIYYLSKILSSKSNKKKFPNEYAIAESLFAFNEIESKNSTKVLELIRDADSILSVTNSLNGYNYNLINFSKLYSIKGDTTKAIYFAKKALMVSESYKNPTDILLSLTQLIKIDKKNAHENGLKYIKVNDSLQLKERSFRDKFAQMQFETNEINQQKEDALRQKAIVVAIAITILIISILIFIISRQRLKQKELILKQVEQKANEEIFQLMLVQKAKEEEARQHEKKRIGRDLHDGVMNRLASTRLNLSLLSISRDDQTIENCLNHIRDIQNIEKEIRNIAHDLSQDSLYDLDSFEPLLNNLLSNLNQTNITLFKLEINPDFNWIKLSSNKRMNLLRIIQEAGNNIIKYAKAQKATISFLMDDKNAYLLIVDNGIGFKKGAVQKGIGIKNMKLRVKIMKGKFNLTSKHNLGTKINISIPLDEE